jgi:hypothetical protein
MSALGVDGDEGSGVPESSITSQDEKLDILIIQPP